MKTTKKNLKKKTRGSYWMRSVWQEWGVTNKENDGGTQTNKDNQPTKHRT